MPVMWVFQEGASAEEAIKISIAEDSHIVDVLEVWTHFHSFFFFLGVDIRYKPRNGL